MRVALYARVSSQRQAERQGIEAQLERLQAHCRANGWDAAQELSFRDDGYSGANANRPGLSALRAKATEGAFDVLLLTAPDRLARDYVWQRLLLDEFRSHNCRVEFLERPMDETPHDRLLLEVRGAVAEYERSLITERMKQGRARKYQAGLLLPFSRAPYGYQLDPERPRDPQGLSVDESEAAVVREIFQLYEDAGSTLRDIIRWLEASGVASPTGKPRWSTSAIRALLTNPSYTGRIYVGRWRTRPATTRASALQPVGRRGQSQTPAPADEWILVAEIPALIGADCFEQVQAKLKRNRQFSLRNTQPERYLLRALVSCGGCGLACRCRKVTDRNGYYFCYERQWPASSRWREERCLARYAPAAQLDDLVWQDLCELLRHPESIAWALERAMGGAWLPQELQARKSQLLQGLAGLRRQLERLTDAYVAGVLPLDEYRRRRNELEARERFLEAQEETLASEVDRKQVLSARVDSVTDFCTRVNGTLTNASFEQKRALVELLIDRVIVFNEEVEIRYVIPLSSKGERTRFCQLRSDYRADLLVALAAGVGSSWRAGVCGA